MNYWNLAARQSVAIKRIWHEECVSRRVIIGRALRTGAATLLLGLSGAALTGCSVGPDYVAPSVTLVPFHNQSPNPGESTALNLDSWWDGFHDALLTRIEDRVLAQNLDLAAAYGRVSQSRAAADEAGAQLLPTGSFSSQVNPMHQSTVSPIGALASQVPGYDRDNTLYDVGVSASWEIDLSGGLHRGAEAADAEAAAVEADRLALRITVAAEAADAYLQLRGAQARIAVAQSQIHADSQLLALVRHRRAEGASTDREVAQAMALLLAAQATLPPLRISEEAQKNRLDVLMGVQAGDDGLALDQSPAIPTPPALPTTLTPADLLRRRPDVIAAERRVAAANAGIGVAISEYYPHISLSGLLGFESLGSSNLFTTAGFQPQGVAGLRWRLFDFGRVDDEVAQAKGGHAAALAQYRQAVLRATEDVENALKRVAELQIESSKVDEEIAALQRSLALSQQSYEVGAITLTDVLDADRELLSAEDQAADLRADKARAAVAAFRAFGGGW